MYTIKTAKRALKTGIRGYLLKDADGKYLCDKVQRLPFYLEGPPGIGKTQIVSQITEELQIGFVSFSITHHTRNSILGLPVIKDVENGKYTEYTMSEVIAKVYEEKGKGYEEGVLLLDEFSCVSETLMPTMLAFLQTKNIGMYSLPDGWMIVLCGNPPEYNRSARKFDAAVMDRVRKMELSFSVKDFAEYAQEKGFHDSVCAYLTMNPENLYYCRQEKNDLDLVTCRSWENLSWSISANEELGEKVDYELIRQFLKYDKIAESFSQFYKMQQSGVTRMDIINILEGKEPEQYRKKWEKKSLKYWMNILEHSEKVMEGDTAGKKDYERISRYIRNTVRFFDGVKWEKALKEKLYLDINASGFLLQVMIRVKNEEYLNIGKMMYGL